MTERTGSPSRLSVALSGKMVQLNISLFILVLLVLGVLFISDRSKNALLVYAGTGIALLGSIAVTAFAISFYIKQRPRPLDGQNVTVSIKNDSGEEITIRNPPDSVFDHAEFKELTRLFLVGYDETMCPDGEVIGEASQGDHAGGD